MSTKEPLELQLKSQKSGKNVAVAWDFFGFLNTKDKITSNQYCFGFLIAWYEDEMRLNSTNKYRLLVTKRNLKKRKEKAKNERT